MSVRSHSSEGSSLSRDGTVKSTTSTSTRASTASSSTSPASAKRQANAIRGQWANEPLPLIESPSRFHDKGHMAILVATEMAHQHNAALRGLNAMYLQAPHVHAPQDIADFFFLMQCWGLWVQHYDDLRRKRMFPTFEEILHKPGCILSRLRGDLEFKPSLNRLLDYVKETHPRVETYDPRIYQELIMKFGLIYQAHLANTICILCALPQICGPPGSSGTDARAGRLYQAYRSLDREASEVMDPNIVPPMLVRMRDTTYEGGNDWPGLPLVAVHVIAEKLSKLHAGAWRFLPCDVWGKPKELPFMGYEAGKGKQRAVPAIPARSPRRLRHEADIVETG